MIEEMQTGVMQQSSVTPVSSQNAKRTLNGMSSQVDGERNSRSYIGAVGKQSYRKPKSQKQNFGKRESSNKKKFPQDLQKSGKGAQTRKNLKESQNGESLLNFHYTSIRGNSALSPTYNGTRRRRNTFNKESFLQANCKFVVDCNEEKYLVHTVDPDILVDWDAIQLAYMPTHENPKCPICLYPPSAAKMTKCGHVYCWSCVLHYLSLSEKTWGKCPICHEAVHEKDLKSVIPIIQEKFSRIDTISMKLMKRSKNSLCATPYSEWKPAESEFPLWKGQPFYSSAKLMLANPETVLENILKREKIELTAQLHDELQEQSGEDCFVQMALEKLNVKLKAYSIAVGTTCEEDNEAAVHKERRVLPSAHDEDSNLSKLLCSNENNEKANAFSDEEIEDVLIDCPDPVIEGNKDVFHIDENANNAGRVVRTSDSLSSDCTVDNDVINTKQDEAYYFYQAEDGQNIFINSLNARCLIEEYGSLDGGPQKIVGQILDFESYTMTKELRKRFRYLSHLPISCEFIICELMLHPPVLSKHTIHNFMPEFKKRKALRMKKMEEQRKFDMKANAEISREAGYRVSDDAYSEVHLNLSDMNDFPSNLSPDDMVRETRQSFVAEDDLSPRGPSFAQMLKNKSANPLGAWGPPRLENRQTDIDSLYTRALPNVPKIDDDDEDGPDIAAPTLREMFSAAMVTQPLGYTENHNSNEGVTSKSAGGKNKKKKKTKGTLLFATGAQRKY